MSIFATPKKTMPMRLRNIIRDKSGVAFIEFALVAPIVLLFGMVGLELSNYALAKRRISQATMAVADNLSRIGLDSGLSAGVQMRESDINDAIAGYKIDGGAVINGTAYGPTQLEDTINGRIIISSLEQNPANSNNQWIHWQRCAGMKSSSPNTPWTGSIAANGSSYGIQGAGATGSTFVGMGPTGAVVTAPDTASAVMYVETWYDYQPLFPSFFGTFGATGTIFDRFKFPNSMKEMHYTSAYLVRDKRDLTQLYNPNDALGNPVAPASCATFAS